MWKIVLSLVVAAVGIAMIFIAQYEKMPGLMFIAALVEIGSFLLLIWGLRDFFMADVLLELQRMNASLSASKSEAKSA